MRRILAAALLSAISLAGGARAESTDVDAITLGALVERADAVVVAVAEGAPGPAPDDAVAWTFRVREALRGAEADAALRVVLPAHRARIEPETRVLAFLRRTDTGWAALELPWALRATDEPGVAAFVEYARSYSACLGRDGVVADPERLARHLVGALGSRSSGIPFSAGRDLFRHEELHPLLTPEQRAAVTSALRTPRKPDHDFVSIVLAAGPCGGPGTDEALVARLLDPEIRPQRRHVVAALSRRASAEVVTMLARRLDGADAAQRADVANALGRLGLREAERPLLPLLRDESPDVRFEAAHSLGLVARAVRAPRPGDAPEAPRPRLDGSLEPLLAAFGKATSDGERRAHLWAVAQIDTPAAWGALRRVAKDGAEESVREIAQRLLERPRTSLLPE